MRLINYPREGRTGLKRWIPSWKLVLGSFVALGAVGVAAFLAAVYFLPTPQPNDVAVAKTTILYYDDGKTELGRLGEVNRVTVPLDDMGPYLGNAVLAAEDREFYNHGGFSPMAIGRAAFNNVTGGVTQGASTITQQYAKNAYLSQEQTYVRKFKELVLSVKLETQESKGEILANYLNSSYFGRSSYGAESASQAYFGKPAKKLTLNESAALAALLRAPSALEQDRPRLKERFDYVLDGMLAKGWITQKQRDEAKLPKFDKWNGATNYFKGTNGYLLQSVEGELKSRGYTEDDINLGGLRIVTTFDEQAQQAAVDAVASSGPQYNTEGVRIGLASVEPGTGEVKAMYGGKNYLKDQLNNADQGIVLAGSTFKPFALAAALEEGVSLGKMFNGASPQTIEGYTLRNYDGQSFGMVSLLYATMKSINTPYVRLGLDIGTDKVKRAAIDAGIPKDTVGLEADPTTVLGTASPTPLDMAAAYATFADNGKQVDPTTIRTIEREGKVVYELDPALKRAFTTDVANNVNCALQWVVSSNGTGYAATGLGRPAAGKTGTTDNNRSASFVGYTPQLSTAVMMSKSNKDGDAVSLSGTGGMYSVTGGSFPAQMWTSYMSGALADEPVEYFDVSRDSCGWAAGGAAYTPDGPASESPSATPSTSDTATPSNSARPTNSPGEGTASPANPKPRPSSPTPSGTPVTSSPKPSPSTSAG